jgi:hypothetical protein
MGYHPSGKGYLVLPLGWYPVEYHLFLICEYILNWRSSIPLIFGLYFWQLCLKYIFEHANSARMLIGLMCNGYVVNYHPRTRIQVNQSVAYQSLSRQNRYDTPIAIKCQHTIFWLPNQSHGKNWNDLPWNKDYWGLQRMYDLTVHFGGDWFYGGMIHYLGPVERATSRFAM